MNKFRSKEEMLKDVTLTVINLQIRKAREAIDLLEQYIDHLRTHIQEVEKQ